MWEQFFWPGHSRNPVEDMGNTRYCQRTVNIRSFGVETRDRLPMESEKADEKK
jgi:hypothetical protein